MAKLVWLAAVVAILPMLSHAAFAGIGNSFGFLCNRTGDDELLPVFIDAEFDNSTTSINIERTAAIYAQLANNMRLQLLPFNVEAGFSFELGECALEVEYNDREFLIPVLVVKQGGSAIFGLGGIYPGAPLFDISQTITVGHWINENKYGFMTSRNPVCVPGAEGFIQVPTSDIDPFSWSLEVQELIVDSPDYTVVTFDESGPLFAKVSTLSSKIELPFEMYNAVLDSLHEYKEHVIYEELKGEGIHISNCESSKVFDHLPFISLTFSEGVSKHIPAWAYTTTVGEECFLRIIPSPRDDLVTLGMPLFIAGVVQLERDTITMCEKNFNDGNVYGEAYFAMFRTKNPTRYDDYEPTASRGSTGNQILIGITIGGIVAILAVITFFIWKAKKKARVWAQRCVVIDKFAPDRAMIRNGSVLGSDCTPTASVANEPVTV